MTRILSWITLLLAALLLSTLFWDVVDHGLTDPLLTLFLAVAGVVVGAVSAKGVLR